MTRHSGTDMSRSLRRFAHNLRSTPLHPQWFAVRRQGRQLREICSGVRGIVVDIGCAGGAIRERLDDGTRYYGLDYYDTATQWYHTRPDVFGDAQSLPFRDSSVDHVFLMEVMEHLPDPDSCMQEIFRILRNRGTLVLSTPFLYPIHDAPLDFRRWTAHGLEYLADRHGFRLESLTPRGRPIETAALLANIALSRLAISLGRLFRPLAILWLPVAILVPTINSLAWLLARADRDDAFMAHGYQALLTKP